MELERKKEIAALLIGKAVEVTNTTEHDVFVGYAPHVNWIDVRIYRNGWYKGATGTSIFVNFDKVSDTEEEFWVAMNTLEAIANN